MSKVVFWGIFRNIPSHNTGTTPEPHQIPRFLYFILDNNSGVQGKGVSVPACGAVAVRVVGTPRHLNDLSQKKFTLEVVSSGLSLTTVRSIA